MNSLTRWLVSRTVGTAALIAIYGCGNHTAAPVAQNFVAVEARQAVAVDANFLYAIDNKAIGRYNKHTYATAGKWIADSSSAIQHLNSGVVVDNKLYCAHSNYPNLPMTSSIEIWDTKTFRHIGSHSFGIYAGSATWIDDHDDAWWVMFAHYAGKGGEPGKGPEWSRLIKFDRQWQPLKTWALPAQLLALFHPYSNSGGTWGDDGFLYLTGHNGAWIYAVQIPETGAELRYIKRLPAPIDGQGIAWEPHTDKRKLYGIVRSKREIHSSHIPTLIQDKNND